MELSVSKGQSFPWLQFSASHRGSGREADVELDEGYLAWVAPVEDPAAILLRSRARAHGPVSGAAALYAECDRQSFFSGQGSSLKRKVACFKETNGEARDVC